MTKTNYINVTAIPPTANFTGTPTTGNYPLLVTFTDSSTGDAGTVWNWSFGDGIYSALQNPTHSYTTVGSFTVTMIVNNSGGSDTKTRVNYINTTTPLNVVDFTSNVTFGYIPFNVQFNDTSTGPAASAWNWSFGDGNYSAVQDPVHEYNVIGLFTVTLTVQNDGGINQTIKVAYINSTALVSAPVSSFIMNTSSGPAPLGVSFNDTSIFVPTTWNWSFGDGNYSAVQNTSHLYPNEGVYIIKLNVSNAFGFNTSQQTLYVINITTGGGGSSSSASGPVWIDANTLLSFATITIPAVLIMVYLLVTNRRREDE